MSTKQTTLSKNISKEIIEYYLPPNPIIIEAGAHIGRDTVKMKKKWPQCTIHAFEPVSELFATLVQNTQMLSNVYCYPYALSTTTAHERCFYISSGRSTATSSLFKPANYTKEHPKTIFTKTLVQTFSLDDWSQHYAVHHVDVLWLDMQGGELDALRGAKNLLKKVSVIYTEVSLHERYTNTSLYPEIKGWLESQGFSVAHEAIHDTLWGNVLFVRY